MIDRRHFLIGAGALLTAPFVRRASAFSQKDRQAADFAAVAGAGGDALRLLANRKRGRQLASATRARPAVCATGSDLARASAQPWAFTRELMTKSSAPAESMICLSMISTPASTASGGRTDGTTSPGLKRRRFTCSRASIWVTQDQRLGRPAKSSSRSSADRQATPTLGLNCTMT